MLSDRVSPKQKRILMFVVPFAILAIVGATWYFSDNPGDASAPPTVEDGAEPEETAEGPYRTGMEIYDRIEGRMYGPATKLSAANYTYANEHSLFPSGSSSFTIAHLKETSGKKLETLKRLETTELPRIRELAEAAVRAVNSGTRTDIMNVMNKLTSTAVPVRFVVTGQESVGKSTVLNSIIGRQLSFMRMKKATMQPVVITLQYAPPGEEEYFINGIAMHRFEDLMLEMEKRFKSMKDDLIEKELPVTIKAPFVTFPCVLVDLPGHTPYQPENSKRVLNMVRNYAEMENTVFVHVSDGSLYAPNTESSLLNVLKAKAKPGKIMYLLNKMALLRDQNHGHEAIADMVSGHLDFLGVRNDMSNLPFLLFIKKDKRLDMRLSSSESVKVWQDINSGSIGEQKYFMDEYGDTIRTDVLQGRGSYPEDRLGLKAWKSAVVSITAENFERHSTTTLNEQDARLQQDFEDMEEQAKQLSGGSESLSAAFSEIIDTFTNMLHDLPENAGAEVQDLRNAGGEAYFENRSLSDERTEKCTALYAKKSTVERKSQAKESLWRKRQQPRTYILGDPAQMENRTMNPGEMITNEARFLANFFITMLPKRHNDTIMKNLERSTDKVWVCDHDLARQGLKLHGMNMFPDYVIAELVSRMACVLHRNARAALFLTKVKLESKSRAVQMLISNPEVKTYLDENFEKYVAAARNLSMVWIKTTVDNQFNALISDRELKTKRPELAQYFRDLQEDSPVWKSISDEPRCYHVFQSQRHSQSDVYEFANNIALAHYCERVLGLADSSTKEHMTLWTGAFKPEKMKAWATELKRGIVTDDDVARRFGAGSALAEAKEFEERLRKYKANMNDAKTKLWNALPAITRFIRDEDPVVAEEEPADVSKPQAEAAPEHVDVRHAHSTTVAQEEAHQDAPHPDVDAPSIAEAHHRVQAEEILREGSISDVQSAPSK